ncbi:MAG: hypothetical protein ACRDV9_12410, partial [Acidimicrobiia bacterium]
MNCFRTPPTPGGRFARELNGPPCGWSWKEKARHSSWPTGERSSGPRVIESLGHIGHSTKAQGEAIGHKGIGFKSVLELCLSPQLFSGLQQPSIELAVGFHPEKALERIRG